MSYHILHITTPSVFLYCEKGFLFCKFDDDSENKLPLDDLRAIIIATHQVSFTNSCLATLLDNDVVVLHCNNLYKPMGWTVGLDRVIRTNAFYNQIAQNSDFCNDLWKLILRKKVENQAKNLDLMDIKENVLWKLVNRPLLSEGNIAKQYWTKYFEKMEVKTIREHKGAEKFENICLNYGYAVFSTLIYRSILVHGLCPNLGIHHREKYDSAPLIYDLVEPFRAFVDFYLWRYKVNEGGSYKREDKKEWSKYLAYCMKNYRLKSHNFSYKIIDFVDIFVEDITRAFINYDTNTITLPDIKEQYLHIDTHRNREYEE